VTVSVWYVTQGFSIRGGHEAHLLHFATEMKRRGFETRVVVPDALPQTEHLFMRQLRERGIPLESLLDHVSHRATSLTALLFLPWALRESAVGRPPKWGRLRAFVGGRCVAAALRDKIKRENPDIIHILGRMADDLWDVFPAERCVFHHGTEGKVDASWTAEELRHFVDFAERAAVNLAPGQGVAENVHREFGIKRPIEPLFTICPDAAGEISRRDVQDAEKRQTRFGILCRMTEEKGIYTLLEALRLYCEKYGAIDFTFAGSGRLECNIADFIHANGLDGVRQVPEFESPVEILSTLDVFVHPSISDAMPMAVAEALMCGLPCIVTKVGGVPDLIREGQEGTVILPNDVSQLMRALEAFASMPTEQRVAFSVRARRRYEAKCRPESIGRALSVFYEAILKLQGRGRCS
jgi:glycosyltransferase involved in cell wall biosynthesis